MFTTRPARRTVRPIGGAGIGPRTVARPKRLARSLTAMLVAAGSVAALAGPAQAFSAGTCNAMFGAGQVQDVTGATINTGAGSGVDFGDNPYASHKPGGKAVVCWAANGRIAVVGRLFADPHHGATTARVRLVYSNNGVPLLSWLSPGVTVSAFPWGAASQLIAHATPPGEYDAVSVRLYNGNALVASQVHTD